MTSEKKGNNRLYIPDLLTYFILKAIVSDICKCCSYETGCRNCSREYAHTVYERLQQRQDRSSCRPIYYDRVTEMRWQEADTAASVVKSCTLSTCNDARHRPYTCPTQVPTTDISVLTGENRYIRCWHLPE